MNTTERRTELALRKQRLLTQSATLRADFVRYAEPLAPLFGAADRAHAALRWLKNHPALPIAVLVATLVARPRAIFRWARRGWFIWQALGNLPAVLLRRP